MSMTTTSVVTTSDEVRTEEGAQAPARGLRLLHLWILVPLAFTWFVHSVDTIEPFDLWWNVKSGEIMAQTGRFLSSDVLVWTPVRQPYSNPQWGSQLLFYWIYNISPYVLLTARVLIVTGTMGIMLWLLQRRTGSVRVASVATLIAYLTGLTNTGMRPQLLAWLPFILFMVLLERKDEHPRWLPLLAPIMLFWVNVHGSFFLGVAMLGIYAAGTVLERVGSAEGRKWLTSRAALWQAGCFAAAGLMTLVNPYFDFIYRYFFIATNDPIARSLNVEWQAPTIYDGTGFLFHANLLIFVASIYFSRRKMRATEILLVLAFGYLALTSLRNVLWWGWVTAPILAANFAAIAARRNAEREVRNAESEEADEDNSALRTPSSAFKELPALNWAIAVLLVGSALLFTPLWRPVNPLVPAKEVGALSESTPVELARFVKEKQPPAPLFNYMEWGGYLEWELYPRYRMFIDGRFEARQVQVWKDYLSVSRGRADWQRTLDHYGVQTLILSKSWHADLITIVEASRGWEKVYSDEMGVVYTRKP